MNDEEFQKHGGDPNKVMKLFNVTTYLVVTSAHWTKLYIKYANGLTDTKNIPNPTNMTVNCPNVVGAGDIMMAMLSVLDYSSLKSLELVCVIELAMGVATLKCTKPYLGGDIRDLLHEFMVDYTQRRFMLNAEPLSYSEGLLKRVKDVEDTLMHKIILINGSFDILHEGHFKLFECAADVKDMYYGKASIIIALNSDESIRLRKGNRPINTLNTRFMQVAPFCDYVYDFNTEDELETLCKLMKPEVMVKGSDYKGKPITGVKYCNSIIYQEHTGISSTDIKKKILEQQKCQK